MNLKLLVLASFAALLVFSMASCDKGKGTDKDEDTIPEDTVWTWDLCTTAGWDTLDDTWHVCDSLLYLDVRAACEWEEGEEYKAMYKEDVAKWKDNIQYWRGLKKLSPRIKELYFSYHFHYEDSPNLTELPPEIWEMRNLGQATFTRLPKLKALPDIQKPSTLWKIRAQDVVFPIPKGLGWAQIDGLHWFDCKMDTISENLLEISDRTLYMTIDYCGLTKIPDWISEMKHIWAMNLIGNEIPSIPTGVGSMLQEGARVDLAGNIIDSMPEIFCEIDGLLPFVNGNKICSAENWPSCWSEEKVQNLINTQDCE